jgi:hypothetical protein
MLAVATYYTFHVHDNVYSAVHPFLDCHLGLYDPIRYEEYGYK